MERPKIRLQIHSKKMIIFLASPAKNCYKHSPLLEKCKIFVQGDNIFQRQNGGIAMRRFFAYLLALLFFVSVGFLSACGKNGEPKKKADKSESDWSASGTVKDIEEMQKAAEKKN